MVRNIYFIAFNRYLIRKNTTNYSKSQQTTEAEARHFLYFDCKKFDQVILLELYSGYSLFKKVVLRKSKIQITKYKIQYISHTRVDF